MTQTRQLLAGALIFLLCTGSTIAVVGKETFPGYGSSSVYVPGASDSERWTFIQENLQVLCEANRGLSLS